MFLLSTFFYNFYGILNFFFNFYKKSLYFSSMYIFHILENILFRYILFALRNILVILNLKQILYVLIINNH
jgi:hypothetical protein